MKKSMPLILVLLSLLAVSCAKERTCSCTSTTTTNGFTYDIDVDANNNLIQIKEPLNYSSPESKEETTFNISKRKGGELCPVSQVYTEEFVDTVRYQTFIMGDIYTQTHTMKCDFE